MTTATSIQHALRPLLVTCFILGLGIIKQPKSKTRWITCLNILYPLTLWLAYVYLFYYTVNLFTWKLLFQSTVVMVVTYVNIITAFVSAIINFHHQKRFGLCMKKLATVDDTLQELGTPKMYQETYMRSKIMVIGWVIYSLSLNSFDTVWWLNLKETASWGLFIAHILNHCIHINAFVDLLFIFLLWYIGTRFDKINEHLQCLVKEELRCTWKKPVMTLQRYTLYSDNYKQIVWSSMHLHLELCRIAREVNLIFGTQMTFEVMSYFVFITSICYGFCLMVMHEFQYEMTIYGWLNISYWFFISLMRVFIVNYVCESVEVKANKIDKIIHQLTSTLQYADVWKEIYQFILQAMHRPLKFTGMGLFYFGNEFLRKFYMTIATYVIIMAQMKMSVFSPDELLAKRQ